MDASPNRSLTSDDARQISICGQSVRSGEAAIRAKPHSMHYVICYTPPHRASETGVPDMHNLRDYVMSLGYLQAPVVVADGVTWSGFRPDRITALAAHAA